MRTRGRPPNDLSGLRFGNLVAVEMMTERRRACVVWRCECDCGAEIEAPSRDLAQGKVKSCGCLRGFGDNHAGTVRIAARLGLSVEEVVAAERSALGKLRAHLVEWV